MGICASKTEHNPYKKQIKRLKEKIRFLEREINRMRMESERERRIYERELAILNLHKREMKAERKKLREQVKMLKKNKHVLVFVEETEKLERRDNRAAVAVAADKWKKLYFDIKTELDQLIENTRQGERLYREANEEQNMMAEVNGQFKSKEDTIEVLKMKLASTLKEEYTREREVDIRRQCLRILSGNKIV